MNVAFSCPSCGLSGSLDESFAGRPVRCKQCRHRFQVPGLDEPAVDGYALDEPAPKALAAVGFAPPPDSTYAPARGDDPGAEARRRASKPRKPGPKKKAARPDREDFPWGKWLLRGAIGLAVALVLVTLIAPDGTAIAGQVLMIVGSLMILVGYWVGLYAAYREDSLYAFLYFFIPFYSAYYVVSRWDDMWRWFACSTAGFLLVLLGTAIYEWSGVAA